MSEIKCVTEDPKVQDNASMKLSGHNFSHHLSPWKFAASSKCYKANPVIITNGAPRDKGISTNNTNY